MRPSPRSGGGIALLLLLAWLAACANVRPLEGGPRDVTPPLLLSGTPPDSSVGVGSNPMLHLRFSERLNASAARGALRTYPSLPRPEVRVKGSEIEIRYVDSLPPDTTLIVVLGKGIQDAAGRDNPLPAEIWLLYATGDSLRAGAVFGRITVKGRPEAQAAVQFEPVTPAETADSAAAPRRGPRPRLPVAACDAEGLFQMQGLPVGREFRLQAFVDRNANLEPDEEELHAFYGDTLRLAAGEIRRGLQWNLVDPNEPGTVSGVVFNSTDVVGPVAVMLISLDSLLAASPGLDATGEHSRIHAPAETTAAKAPADSLPTPRLAPEAANAESAGTREAHASVAESLQVDLETTRRDSFVATQPHAAPPMEGNTRAPTLPVAPRGPWESAYASLSLPDSAARRRVVYASPRGDYSMKIRPGRHRLLAFVDVSGDSLPGTYVTADSSRLEWEPLWMGGVLEVLPGAEVRPRAIDIDARR